jgi:hypothetical protein
MPLKEIYEDFLKVLDEHRDLLETRPHNYIKILGKEYTERFPDNRELTNNQIYRFIAIYRLTHDDIERKHAKSYSYNLKWRAKKNSEK